MVTAHPNLGRKFRNTGAILDAKKAESIPGLQTKYPNDYIDIETHRTMERVKPWAEIPSPIAKDMFGIMSKQKSLQPITIDKTLILCVDFNDKPSQLPIESIYNRFFEDFANSMKEYYKEVSHSRYIPYGEIHGWYRAPNPSIYYTNNQNGFGTYPNSAEKLVEDTINIALQDPTIDWPSFDTNNNGYIDNLIVIHSGAEAAWTGNVNDFWAHVYVIPTPKIVQGKAVWVYAMMPEYLDIPANYRLVGIDAHEHGHQLGLPDLYDYSDLSNGVGSYSLMGSGSWALKGMSGVHLDAWSKYVLGFADATIDPVGTVYIDNSEMYTNVIKYTTSDPKEYFLLENRQKILYDTYLPSEGILIWHINENQTYNDNELCYLVGLIQSDNLKDLENRANSGDLGDPYPGITNNRSFGRYTTPNSILCNNATKSLLIDNISDSGATMSFNSSFPPVPNSSIKFTTNPPGADIYFDMILQGTTDSTTGILKIDYIPAGTINYIVKKVGYHDYTASVNTTNGIIVNVPITLVQISPNQVPTAEAGMGGVGVILAAGLLVGSTFMKKPQYQQ